MGKKIKKGTKGEATKYCTRSQALKKLQLKLTEFRYNINNVDVCAF